MKHTTHLDPGRIRYWRERRDMTQQALGETVFGARIKASSALRRVQYWERHGRVWAHYAQALADALDVRLDELVTSERDIAGLWLVWRGSAPRPAHGFLQDSLHGLIDRLFDELPPREHATDRAALDYDHDQYALTLSRHAADGTRRVCDRLRFRRVDWQGERGLMWRRLRGLERATAERLIAKRLEYEAVPMDVRG